MLVLIQLSTPIFLMQDKLIQTVKDLLEHNKNTPIFDDVGRITEEYEEGEWTAHPNKSPELAKLIAKLTFLTRFGE
jgi:hypothetical protein